MHVKDNKDGKFKPSHKEQQKLGKIAKARENKGKAKLKDELSARVAELESILGV